MIKYVHFIFLLYALPLVLLIARITPPFQVPDEPNHFCRAEQIARFQWVAWPGENGKTFLSDKGIEMAGSFYLMLPFHPESKVNREIIQASQNIHWQNSLSYLEFPNTVIYPPPGYVGAAIGIFVGKSAGFSIVNTLVLSRMLNGIICVMICFYAIFLARSKAYLLFTVLLFPMAISLFASVSQDGMLISLAVLVAALIFDTEYRQGSSYGVKRLSMIVICLAAIAAAKPPYLPLALVVFAMSISMRVKILSFASVCLSVVIWMMLNRQNYGIEWAPAASNIHPHEQLQYVVGNPFRFATLFLRINMGMIKDNVWWFIGRLGWEDIVFHPRYYHLAAVVLFISVLMTINQKNKTRQRLRMVAAAATLLSFAAIMTAQYIYWMPLRSPYLGGVQARYFVPLIPFLWLALAGAKPIDLAFLNPRIKYIITNAVQLTILVFPVISIVTLVVGLIQRYYLQ